MRNQDQIKTYKINLYILLLDLDEDKITYN